MNPAGRSCGIVVGIWSELGFRWTTVIVECLKSETMAHPEATLDKTDPALGFLEASFFDEDNHLVEHAVAVRETDTVVV